MQSSTSKSLFNVEATFLKNHTSHQRAQQYKTDFYPPQELIKNTQESGC